MSSQQSKVNEELKSFLDNNQYSRKSILRYEKIFGKTFVSTGGVDTTQDFCKKMELQVPKNSEIVLVGQITSFLNFCFLRRARKSSMSVVA